MINEINTNSQTLQLSALRVGLRSTLRLAIPSIPENATRVEIIVTHNVAVAYGATYNETSEMWECDIPASQFREIGKQTYEIAYLLDGEQFWDGKGWIEIVKATVSGILPDGDVENPRYYITSINGYGASETNGEARIPRLFTGALAPAVSDDYIEYDQYFDTVTALLYIYCKDSQGILGWKQTAGGSGGGGIAEMLIEVSHNDLLTLRNGAGLIPGCKYRITDYVATTAQEGTESANHPFDLILTAYSPTILSERAVAIQHADDTYFPASISDWRVWYSLDNNANIFKWADTTNGKGVIFRLIDGNGNDFPFDFKGITFNGAYCCNRNANPFYESATDFSINGVKNIRVKEAYKSARYLRFNSFAMNCSDITLGEGSADNNFKYATYITLGRACENNDILYGCTNVIMGDFCSDNILEYIDVGISNIIFGSRCERNTIHGTDIKFANGCIDNVIGNQCAKISFGNDCEYIHIGDSSFNLTLGESCSYIIFGNAEDDLYVSSHNITIDNGVKIVKFSDLPEGKSLQNIEIKSGVYSKVIPITYENMLYRDALTTISPKGSYNLKV